MKTATLIDEVTNLIEFCSPVLCHFENEFLKLPREVLVTTMKKHQKYFPILDPQGSPLPCFIADEQHPGKGHGNVSAGA